MAINAPKETILEDANTKIPGHLPSTANNIKKISIAISALTGIGSSFYSLIAQIFYI